MPRDTERIERTQQALRLRELDALVCTLPAHVLMISGYWPMTGTALAVVTREGQVGLVVPEDEQDLAQRGWADELRTFNPNTLEKIREPGLAVIDPLAQIASAFSLNGCRVGYESNETFTPAPYAALHLYGTTIMCLMEAAFPCTYHPAYDLLEELAAVKTPAEIDRIRTACRLTEPAFRHGARHLAPEMTELEAASFFRVPLSTHPDQSPDVLRADGYVYCMSGPNGAQASRSYQISRDRPLAEGDLVLVHCNSYADGYWTDITRTYCLGAPDERQRRMYEAVLAARQAALQAIRPGAAAAAVDAAARDLLAAQGFGKYFLHATGHGTGFAAINHNARPRLHPKSPDRLETGMVFNVEPGVYVSGYGGLRHCDMVALTDHGPEVLTPFQCEPAGLEVF